MVAFHKNNFVPDGKLADENMNLMKVKTVSLDIVGVYKSPKGDPFQLINNLEKLINMTRPTVVFGDFNICLLKKKKNPVTLFLETSGFTQLVKRSAHIEVLMMNYITYF